MIDSDAYVLPLRSWSQTPKTSRAPEPAAARPVRAASPIQPFETARARKNAPERTTATAPIRARMRPPRRSSKLKPVCLAGVGAGRVIGATGWARVRAEGRGRSGAAGPLQLGHALP